MLSGAAIRVLWDSCLRRSSCGLDASVGSGIDNCANILDDFDPAVATAPELPIAKPEITEEKSTRSKRAY